MIYLILHTMVSLSLVMALEASSQIWTFLVCLKMSPYLGLRAEGSQWLPWQHVPFLTVSDAPH